MSSAIALRLTAQVVLPADEACSVIIDGAVDIDGDGRIAHCGPAVDAPPAAGAQVRNLTGMLVPGLVNTHAHTPMVLLRGMGGELPLLRWLPEVIWPAEARLRAADVRAGMLLGSIEMLRHGVTTSAEMYFHDEQISDAVLSTGARLVLGAPVMELPGAGWRTMIEAGSARIDELGLRYGPGERIELGYAPHSAYMLPEQALYEVAEAAKARGALVQIHVAESAGEDAAQREAHGSVPALLAKTGLLDGRLVAAHGVHLSGSDIALLAERGAGIAHCPASNAKLASGIARVADLRAAGVPVGLGTDGPASNDALDLWADARLAAMLARLAASDSTAISAAGAFLMATRHGAAALGRGDLGALEPGRWADLVHIDTDTPAFATGLTAPPDQFLANLIWAAGSRHVRDVWVAGHQVIADTEPTQADRHAAQAAVTAAATRLRAG